jgi:hypothetical protein
VSCDIFISSVCKKNSLLWYHLHNFDITYIKCSNVESFKNNNFKEQNFVKNFFLIFCNIYVYVFDMEPSKLNQLFERHVLKLPMCYNVQGIS